MKEPTLEETKIAYAKVFNYLKTNKKKIKPDHLQTTLQLLYELDKRIKKLSKNESNEKI